MWKHKRNWVMGGDKQKGKEKRVNMFKAPNIFERNYHFDSTLCTMNMY